MLALIAAISPGPVRGRDDMLETCITEIAQGETEALARLYRQTHEAVYGFALSILKDRQDAEDAAHDAYLQIWKAAGRYTRKGKPMAWIFTVTRNLALMRLREKSKAVAMAPEDWQTLFADEPAVDGEDRLILAAVLGALSDEERQIVLLHTMTGLKHREIAALLELGLPTVLSKYSRALKKLRAALKEAD